MNNTSLHWTEDPAILEQFVLGKISPDHMNVLNEHLRTCPQCLHAVEAERDFVRSVRAYGRDQLRVRLREKLEHTPSRTVPWPHVLSAAAIVLVIVGLGIYGNWWREPDLIQSEEQLAGEKQVQGPPSPAAEQGAGIAEKRQKPAEGTGGETPAGKITTEGAKTEMRLEDMAKEEKEAQALPEQPVRAADAKEADHAGIQEGLWVDGTLIDVRSKDKSDRVMAREEAAAPAPAKKGEAQQSLIAAQQGKYLLQQLPENLLPMQQKQLRKGADAVPTKVEPTRDGAVLTAYTDLFDLRNKTVQGEFSGADSLIFIVDGIRIAYKLSSLPVKQ